MILNFLGSLGFQEILLIALVILLFFGGKKIPEMMKGLGKGVKAFKDGMKEVENEPKKREDKDGESGKDKESVTEEKREG